MSDTSEDRTYPGAALSVAILTALGAVGVAMAGGMVWLAVTLSSVTVTPAPCDTTVATLIP